MIDLLPDDDQKALIDNFESVLAAEAPLARLRDGQGDLALLARLAELGWFGLGLPESAGGVGLGLIEEALLFREAGRFLVGPRLFAAVLGAHAAVRAGDPALAAALAGGERGACLLSCDGRHAFDRQPGDSLVRVDEEGIRLFGEAALVRAEPIAGLDPAIALERVELDEKGVRRLADRMIALRMKVLVSASLVGLAEAARDRATLYAKERQQFGQPIGAFQAIKHRCADMAVGCESAWTLTALAALCLGSGRHDAAFQAAAARIVAGDAALAAVRGNVQIHGGMGFTDECEAHLLVKRCHFLLQLAGGTRLHQEALLAEPEPVHGR
jgi:alkylation response protein AidB-like acyl-CoA dehydrogenase